jgi:poly-gamma-glutamate synthesis protein (capsule biosynthesis protein)
MDYRQRSRYTSYSTYQQPPYLHQPKRPKRRSRLPLLVLVTFGIVGAFLILGGGRAKLPAIIKNEPKPQKVRVEGRYLFTGTVVWARHMQEWSVKPDGTTNYAYPFSGLHTFDRAKYDAWTADLECPVMTRDIPTALQETDTAFNCRPEFLPQAAKYFTFFNLANNHTHDFNDEAALVETRQHLQQNGIQHWGDFEPGKTNNICEVMALPVRIVSSTGNKETSARGSLPVAFCAWHYFFRLPLPGEIETMEKYAEVMPVFAFMQAGIEYRPTPDDYQRMMAHKIADQGPQFVVVNSAHWVQDGEVYKGIPILYSTGNFIFDQQYNNEVTRGDSLDGSMTIQYTPELQKWLDLGTTCKAQKDDCFEQIKAKGLQKPKLHFTYDLVASDDSNKLTKRADSTIQQAVEERVGWTAIKAALGQQ